jgi:hypothetical protein
VAKTRGKKPQLQPKGWRKPEVQLLCGFDFAVCAGAFGAAGALEADGLFIVREGGLDGT